MDKELKIAIKAIRLAGEFAKVHFRKFIETSYKDKKQTDIVTEVDIENQRIIVDLLSKNFSYNFLCEEKGVAIPNFQSKYTWIIDPLDGTTNYAHGIDEFNISIALANKGEVILGLVFEPMSNEIFWAIKNKGAWLNGKKIKISQQKYLNKALVVCNYNYSDRHRRKILKNVDRLFLKVGYFRMFNSAELELAYVAAGRVDALVVYKGKPWDVAAGGLIVKEAGGKVTNLDGKNWNFLDGNLIASNGLIHNQIIKVLK